MANKMITTEQSAADLSDVVARLVEEAVAAERERCARICEESQKGDGRAQSRSETARRIAAAIRAQGSKA